MKKSLDKNFVLLGFLFGAVVFLWVFYIYNPNAPNPLEANASSSFKAVKTTTHWDGSPVDKYTTTLFPKSSLGLIPTEEERDQAKREIELSNILREVYKEYEEMTP